MNKNIGIIDLGSGNLTAIGNRLSELGAEFSLIGSPTIVKFSHIILPGVGNFDNFMDKMRSKNLFDFIIEKSLETTKILGICIGMHVYVFCIRCI